MAGCCNQPIFDLTTHNCRLSLKNEAGNKFWSFNLSTLVIDESGMPLQFSLNDRMNTGTYRAEDFDSTMIPDIYADLQAVVDYIQTQIDNCYCPCDGLTTVEGTVSITPGQESTVTDVLVSAVAGTTLIPAGQKYVEITTLVAGVTVNSVALPVASTYRFIGVIDNNGNFKTSAAISVSLGVTASALIHYWK